MIAQLSGKHALITGAAGGIGAATAHLFVNEGADVTLLDSDQGALDRLVAGLPAGRATAICCDVTDTSQMQAAFDSAPKLDVIVLNAGIAGEVAPITDYDENDFDRVMAVNVKGTWLGLKFGVEAMQGSGGSIIVTSSVAGLRGIPRSSAYSASKHAVLGLVKSVAAEVGGKGLRINAVCPSPVETNMMRSLEESAAPGASAKAKAAFERMMLLRRYGAPEEIANMMLFLASDASSYCTGSVFTVDGGYTAT